MAFIISNWKITFDPAGVSPLVLIAFGDRIDKEPRWPLAMAGEEVAIAASAQPFLRDTGNRTVQFQFETYRDEALDSTARRKVMESLILAAPLGVKPLRIEIAGITDAYWQFAQARITNHTPGRLLEAPTARVVRGWTITATGLAEVEI
jgi:hypothetical protein